MDDGTVKTSHAQNIWSLRQEIFYFDFISLICLHITRGLIKYFLQSYFVHVKGSFRKKLPRALNLDMTYIYRSLLWTMVNFITAHPNIGLGSPQYRATAMQPWFTEYMVVIIFQT